MASSTKRKVRFGLATDSHYADREPTGTRFYRQSLQKMEEFVETMNKAEVDFAIHLGDFKDESPDKEEENTLRYLREIEKVYAKFEGPRYHCVGNHDVDSINKDLFLANIQNTGIPSTHSYYSFDYQDFHFVVLDANFNKEGIDHFYKNGADWQDTQLSRKQINWLKSDLGSTDAPTIIFCHHPLFEYRRDGYTFHVNDYQEIQTILQSHGKVIAVFQGHVHEEKYEMIGGIHYITQLGMVDFEGLDNNSFALVEIDDQNIRIEGFKRTASYEQAHHKK